MTTRTITFTVQAPAPTTLPTWFASLPEKAWYPVASSATLRMASETPAQLALASPFDVCRAYQGACVDQSRGEFVFAANGGHANYYGNEVYACQIRSENPRWYRLLDRTPGTHVFAPGGPIKAASSDPEVDSTSNLISGQGSVPSGYAAMFGDGRMRSQHGWHSNIFAEGKVWYPVQASTSGVGYSSAQAWSFDRNYPGLATAYGQTPLGHPNAAPGTSTPGPWTWLGPSDGTAKSNTARGVAFGTAPVAAYDPIGKRVWCAKEGGERSVWSSINVLTSQITGYTGSGGSTGACWATVVYDPSGADLWRYLVVNSRDYTNSLFILNLKLATPTWSQVTVSNSAVNRSGLGAVYHKQSRSILCYDPSDMRDKSVYKIRVPTVGDAYAGGTWNVTPITAHASSANPSDGVPTGGGAASGQYTWSKFNIIEDMGDGNTAALVVCMDNDAPVYVYRLPTTELA